MRTAVVVLLTLVLAVVPVLARTSALAVAAELGAGALAVGLYSCFVVGVFSDVMDASASLQGVELSKVPLPELTVLIAGGTALLAAPFVGAYAVTAVGQSFGVMAGSAYAFSVIGAYTGGALVFEHEWEGGFTRPEWLPAGLPEWVATFTLVTSLAAVLGFNLGVMVSASGR